MTSSLVGSEMCIRDRTCEACAPLWLQNHPSNQGIPRASVLAFRLRNPVSYTHLTLPTICSV
eukprot:4770970-Prorocentrum_lima.AAC.1